MNMALVSRGADAGRIFVAGHRALCDEAGVLVFPDLGWLVVSDLHLEKGAACARRGMMLPPYDTAETLVRLALAIHRHEPRVVVSLGDSFHDAEGAARMPEPFRRILLDMMAGREWYWIAGNHDPHAPGDLPGETVGGLDLDGLTFRHHPSARPAPGEIAGHLHPCARIVQRGRSVRRRCFASDGDRLILPAFGAFTGSLNVLDQAYASLFRWDAFTAYMLGLRRVFPITRSALQPG